MKMNNWIYWKLRWNLLRMQIPNWNLFRQFSLFDLIELKFLLKLQELLLFKTAQNLKLSRYRWTLRVRNTTATADSLIWDPPCLCNLPQIYCIPYSPHCNLVECLLPQQPWQHWWSGQDCYIPRIQSQTHQHIAYSYFNKVKLVKIKTHISHGMNVSNAHFCCWSALFCHLSKFVCNSCGFHMKFHISLNSLVFGEIRITWLRIAGEIW